MFREIKEGRVYGLTFIDNKSGAIFNGSDLGKAYNGQALAKRIENTSPGRTEVQQRYHWNGQALDIEKSGYSTANSAQDVKNIALTLMKAEKSGQEGINPALKKRKQKKEETWTVSRS